MENALELARGPLFAISFLIMVLGLARHIILQLQELFFIKGKRMKGANWRKMISDSLEWLVPVRHLIPGTVFMSIMSIVFHLGIILVPLFLADHIVMWEGFLGIGLPRLSGFVADILTIMTIVAIAGLFAYRVTTKRTRVMSKISDYLVLAMVLLPMLSGYLAAHPNVNPFSWQSTMLTHILSAEALFVIIPFSKLAHIALFPFNRLSGVHWQLQPGAGDKVANALFGEEARV